MNKNELDVDVTTYNTKMATDLYIACRDGDLNAVKHLCVLPVVDPKELGTHAVQLASENGHLEVVKYLCGLPG